MKSRLTAFFALMAACAFLAGCGLIPDPPVRLVTNRAEMAAYIERYNALQNDVRVEIVYQDSPGQAVMDGVRDLGDVIVDEYLATPAVMDRCESLGDMVKPGKIDPAWFYPGLLSMGSRDNRVVLIPISFNLPAIAYYKPSITSDLPSMFIPLDTLRTMSKAFNTVDKNGFPASVGFSPFWEPDFLSASALLFGARIRAGRGGLPAWDPEGLTKTVDFSRSWLTEVNGGVAADRSFQSRTLVQPWYKLLLTKKTLFALTPFSEYFALPEDKRRDMDFRWLSQNNEIPVMNDVLFAGILRSSRNKTRARSFLEWFCSISVQRSLIEVNQSRRIGVFCITDGLSAYRSINEKELPQKYPLLLGHIPSENLLVFPETLPNNWVKVRDEVINPWISATVAGEEPLGLDKKIEEWVRSRKK